jgi:hypothetical protein
MALRRLPYRETEEQIRYYAPARYLCGLTETSWTPDFTTVQDFAELLGEEGVRLINEAVVIRSRGRSEKNVERLRALGARDVGMVPRGRAAWQVEGKVRQRLIRERAKVEGSIGTIKGPKYGFNRPAARSAAMMGVCGQRAALGLNLTKLARGAAGKRGITLAA